MNIPIVVISDNNLAFSVGTLFVNLMETKKEDTFYELNLLVTPDFTEENLSRIKSIEDTYTNKCKINIIVMDDRFNDITNKTKHISNACAYKFCIPEKFPQYDKILYLDTDIIVFEDLEELYSVNPEDNYIAGVFSLHHYLRRRELIKLLEIPNLLKYVNAGVLIFNLDKIRKDNIVSEAVELIGKFDDSIDQHIWNKVCFPNIKLIEPKYNVTKTNDREYQKDEVGLLAFTPKELSQISSPVIYHYTGAFKPWNTLNVRYGIIWLRYYFMSPYGHENYEHRLVPQKPKQKFAFRHKLFALKTREICGKKFIILRIPRMKIMFKIR